jgi:phosphatidylethanolamine-binding protein (PEBP) family uncharacterized protein
MPSEIREWSIPTPVRALLWWPAISFVLVVVDPDAATGVIILAGAALALLGVLLPALARRQRRPRPVVESPTMEFPTLEIPPVPEDRAA